MPLNDSTNTKKLSDIREDSENATKVCSNTLEYEMCSLKKKGLYVLAKSIGTGQPALSAQADQGRNFIVWVKGPADHMINCFVEKVRFYWCLLV